MSYNKNFKKVQDNKVTKMKNQPKKGKDKI